MSDPPTNQSAVLLESILQTLKQINEKLSVQEQRGDRLGEGQGSSPTLPSRLGVTRPAWVPLSPLNTANFTKELPHSNSVAAQRLQRGPSYEGSNHNHLVSVEVSVETREDENSTPDYRSWRSRLEDSPLHQHSFVTEELGDAWTIPDDGRLPLSFSREVLEGLSPQELRSNVFYISKFRDRMTRSSELCFYIIDYDAFARHTIYRLGEPIVVGIQQWRLIPGINLDEAPWRRFVLCQGLNTVQQIDHDSTTPTGCSNQAPFLLAYDRCNTRNYLTTAIDRHIECLMRDQSLINPFETYWESFYITFYEARSVSIPEVTKDLPSGQWRHGSLYGSEEFDLYESALTLIAIPAASNRPYQPTTYELGIQHKRVITREHACSEWSILLLAPLGFFDSSYHRLPLEKDDFMARLGGRSMEGATISLLEATYRRIHYNWRLFHVHFQELLDQGNEEIALFDPALHDELLQDDERFSRSRKYAWAINCLKKFERSIGDNILQWKRFKSARLDHLLKPGILSEQSRKSVEKIEQYCTELEALHQYFSKMLISTSALRDGLFSASAVIETRASTHLAKNIRLLTYVSIFFQPLAFCTSLWSINNTFSSKALIYTSMLVGLSTYIIVFHLNNLVYQASSAYTPIRNSIITRMKDDSREHWASKGNQLATFPLRLETSRPSEWWILAFGLQSIFESFTRLPFREKEPANCDTEAPPATIITSDGNGGVTNEAEIIASTAEELSVTATASGTSSGNNETPTSESPA